jgi:hypothetical protein
MGNKTSIRIVGKFFVAIIKKILSHVVVAYSQHVAIRSAVEATW